MQETATLSVVVVAATQFSCSDNINENISKAKHFVRMSMIHFCFVGYN